MLVLVFVLLVVLVLVVVLVVVVWLGHQALQAPDQDPQDEGQRHHDQRPTSPRYLLVLVLSALLVHACTHTHTHAHTHARTHTHTMH